MLPKQCQFVITNVICSYKTGRARTGKLQESSAGDINNYYVIEPDKIFSNTAAKEPVYLNKLTQTSVCEIEEIRLGHCYSPLF